MPNLQISSRPLILVGLDPAEMARLARDLRRGGVGVEVASTPALVIGSDCTLIAAFPEALRLGEQAARVEVGVLWAVREPDLAELEARLPGAPFILRPVRPAEAALRLRRLWADRGGSGVMRFGMLEIDRRGGWVRVEGHEVHLTAKEFTLLLALADRAGAFVSQERLMAEIWPERSGTSRTLQIHIRRLRTKLGPAGGAVETRVKLGYRLVPEALEPPNPEIAFRG